jgi:hypothetical protein
MKAEVRRMVEKMLCEPRRWQASLTLSRTVSSPKRRMFWKVRERPAAAI